MNSKFGLLVGIRKLVSVLMAALLAGCLGSATTTTISGPGASSDSIGGTVTGLSGTLVLQDNGGDNLTVVSNGSFTFGKKLPGNTKYAVTVLTLPSGETCTVSNDSGTTSTSNVTNVAVVCVNNTYTVGGTVNGLTSGSVDLQDNNGDTITVGNGTFTFPTQVSNGSTFSVTIYHQPYIGIFGPSPPPTFTDQTCSVSNGTGTIAGANVTNVIVTCSATTYTVGGTVTGLKSFSALELQDNNDDNLSVQGNGTFTFHTQLADTSPYSVTVSRQPYTTIFSPIMPNGQTCSVSNGTGTIAGANITNVMVTCSSNTYTVGGTVTGLNGSLVLQDNGVDNLTVTSNGPFSFVTGVINGGPYKVTILTQPIGQTCTVSNGSGTSASPVSNVAVVCVGNNYYIGGTISGLDSRYNIVLQNNNGETTNRYGSGYFTFPTPLANGSHYSVTVSALTTGWSPAPPPQTCSVSNGTGTIAGANVTNVIVTCAAKTYTVGGAITGLMGSVWLQDNNGDSRVFPNGNFTFPTQFADGSPYSVTIVQQPYQNTISFSPQTYDDEICSISNNAGTIAGANVANVSVTCQPALFISVSVTGLNINSTFVLQDNNGENLTVTDNGLFDFPTPISGLAYNVTVTTQPYDSVAGPTFPTGQACTVTNGSGTAATGSSFSGNRITLNVNCL